MKADGTPCHLVTQIGKGPLDPPIAPIPVLCCQSDDQLFNLALSSRPSWATILAPVVLLGDQLPVPGQESFRSDDGGDFPQDATAKHFGLGRQATALVVVQTETLVAELLSQHSVLFTEIIDGVALLLTQPSGDRNQQQSKRIEGLAHGVRIASKTIVMNSAACTI